MSGAALLFSRLKVTCAKVTLVHFKRKERGCLSGRKRLSNTLGYSFMLIFLLLDSYFCLLGSDGFLPFPSVVPQSTSGFQASFVQSNLKMLWCSGLLSKCILACS